jgi:hypothetical protein
MRTTEYSRVHLRLFESSLWCLNPIRGTSSLIHLVLTRGTSRDSSFSTGETYDRSLLVSRSKRLYFSTFPPKVFVELSVLQSDSSVIQEVMTNTLSNPSSQDTPFSLSGESPCTIPAKNLIAGQDVLIRRVAFRLDYRREPNTSLTTVTYDRGYRQRGTRATSSRVCSVPNQVVRCKGVIIVA